MATNEKGQAPVCAVTEALKSVNSTMNRLWNPMELVEELHRIDGMSTLAAQLYTHLLGAVPILRAIATELQAKLDEKARRRYADPTSGDAVPVNRKRQAI